MSLHVLFAPSWYPTNERPHDGSFFREQVQMLLRAGYKVGVIDLDPVVPWLWRPGMTIDDEDGITVIRSKAVRVHHEKLPGDATLYRWQAAKAFLRYEERCGKPDIVHAHSVFPGIYTAAAAARQWNIPYVLTEHRPSSLDRPKNSGRGRSIIKAVRRADNLAAVSTPFAELLEDYYHAGPWKVIALPVPQSQSRQKLPHRAPGEPFTFCHVSHWDENKRVDMTMRAFAKAHAANPNTYLTLVGGVGDYMEKMKALRNDLSLENAVTLIPRQPRERIAELMSESHCFVLASAVEAGGTVFAEAQIAGLPCIGTKTFAGRFMIEPEAGIQVPIDDVNALANAMVEIALDDHHTFSPEKIHERAVERFSEETFVRASTDFYQEALSI